ncbi:MAG: GGDEF domain-containing protein [Fibrobacter sp.]|jgi:diguanylate cyclase (GGDEF)-like protein|nr:GGDEF domain-containing protein [Fibrobacter sp.]
MMFIFQKIAFFFRINFLIFILLSLTIAVILLNKYSLNTTFTISPATYPYIVAESDSVDGGNSTIDLIKTDSSVIIDYELKEGIPYPYVNLQIFLGDGRTIGKDFSVYDSIYLWIKPRGEGSVRFYLRGWDPAFSRKDDPSSLKFNELEYFPLEENYPAVFVPEEFRVSGWWVAQKGINAHKARMDISNVPLIEIQTGTGAALGYGTLEIFKISFRGKIIPKETLYASLVAVWFIAFLLILVFRIFDYSRERKINRRKREELEKNLQALKIEKDSFEKSSKEDPLTGCLNRAGFSSILTREQFRLNYNGTPLSFIILDIDHFKDINDQYGHDIGDTALIELAKLLQSRIRSTDSLVRWGGEEFVVLCGDTPLQNAQFLAEKLRQAIERAALIPQQKITCSFGVAEMFPGEDTKAFFNRADKALYTSKQNGRNCVTASARKKE